MIVPCWLRLHCNNMDSNINYWSQTTMIVPCWLIFHCSNMDSNINYWLKQTTMIVPCWLRFHCSDMDSNINYWLQTTMIVPCWLRFHCSDMDSNINYWLQTTMIAPCWLRLHCSNYWSQTMMNTAPCWLGIQWSNSSYSTTNGANLTVLSYWIFWVLLEHLVMYLHVNKCILWLSCYVESSSIHTRAGSWGCRRLCPLVTAVQANKAYEVMLHKDYKSWFIYKLTSVIELTNEHSTTLFLNKSELYEWMLSMLMLMLMNVNVIYLLLWFKHILFNWTWNRTGQNKVTMYSPLLNRHSHKHTNVSWVPAANWFTSLTDSESLIMHVLLGFH